MTIQMKYICGSDWYELYITDHGKSVSHCLVHYVMTIVFKTFCLKIAAIKNK